MRSKMRRILFVLLLFWVSPAAATIYYVNSAGGSDSNNGTSLATAYATISKAAGVVNPGDTVNVRAGNGYTGALTLGRGGSSGNYVTFQGYPGDAKPVINAVSGDYVGIAINANYIIINGFNVQGVLTNSITYANGIQAGTQGSSTIVNHIIIENNITANNPGGGIGTTYSDYVTIQGNITSGNANNSIYGASGISIGFARNSDTSTVMKNFVLGNTSFNNVEKVVETVCGAICDGEGIIIDDLSNSQTDGVAYLGATLVENNLSYSNGSYGIEVDRSSNTTVIYNTTYQNGTSGFNNGEINTNNAGKTGPLVFENNIMYATSGKLSEALCCAAGSGPITFDYNLIFNGTDSGLGSHDKKLNPLFVANGSNFSLQSSSPAIGMANPAYTVATDILGNPRPSGGTYDVGAYEFQSGGGGGGASPNFTVIVLGSTAAITDANSGLWTITSGKQVALNGTTLSATANTLMLAYVNSVVWEETTSDVWYSLTATGAIASGPTSTSPLQPPQIWYVNSATGNDSNDGLSLGTPFLTPQHAAAQTAPGDTVNMIGSFGGGAGGTAPLVISTSGNGAGFTGNTPCFQPITYQSYFGSLSRAVINGTRAAAAISGADPLACIVINNLEIAGWDGALTWAGASANAGASGTSWQAPAYTGSGIVFTGAVGGTVATSVNHMTISNNFIHDFPGSGIAVNYGDYLTITGNDVYSNNGYSPYGTSGITLSELHNIDAGTGTKNYVVGNRVRNNIQQIPSHASITLTTTGSGTTASGSATITVASATGAAVAEVPIDVTNGCIPPGAYIASTGTGTITLGGGSVTTCNITDSSTIQVGYATDSEGILIADNTNAQSNSVAYVGRTLVTNSLVYGNGGAGLQCAPTSKNCDFTFNTLYQNQQRPDLLANTGAPGEINSGATTGSNFYNNILDAKSGVPSGWDQSTNTTIWQNNGFFGGNASHTLPGTGNVLTNPNFVAPGLNSAAAFQLTPGSPAIDAGSGSFTRSTDFAGNPGLVGPSYDLGALESPCSPFGANTVTDPGFLTSSVFQDGQPANSINSGDSRAATVTLWCRRAPWAN